MNKLYVGIDPGKKGALACVEEDGTVFDTIIMPLAGSSYDIGKIRSWFEDCAKYGDVLVCVEQPIAMPGQSSVSTATAFTGFGILLGIVEGRWPLRVIPPQKWQKAMHEGCSGSDTKARSVQACTRLFPAQKVLGPRGGMRDGLADALLIAEHARRTWK